jgi:hypothetical protein
MPIEDYLEIALRQLETMYEEMSKSTGNVLFREVGPYRQFRHEPLTDSLACYLKAVKSISTLNACLVLLRHGYTQEIGALCRMVDDFCNEIFFLLKPQGEDGNFSGDQILFLENFFQEELDQPGDPLASTQKRATVPVKKIHATFAKLASTELNSSDAQELLRTTQQAFSGYVHGAYPHIMEMYGGEPPQFHLSGMLGTPRIDEWRKQLVGYVHRVSIASVFVARKLGLEEMETSLRAFLKEFEDATGTAPNLPASEMLAEYKRARRGS